jgi:ribonuclease P protein component
VRVRKRPDFKRIQSQGRRVYTAHFVLLLHARQPSDSGAETSRLGVTVSRRVGSAVVRNRAKRLVREAFRATRDLWDEDLDLVVIVRKPPGSMKLADVQNEWRHAQRTLSRRAAEARRDREKRQSELAQRP